MGDDAIVKRRRPSKRVRKKKSTEFVPTTHEFWSQITSSNSNVDQQNSGSSYQRTNLINVINFTKEISTKSTLQTESTTSTGVNLSSSPMESTQQKDGGKSTDPNNFNSQALQLNLPAAKKVYYMKPYNEEDHDAKSQSSTLKSVQQSRNIAGKPSGKPITSRITRGINLPQPQKKGPQMKPIAPPQLIQQISPLMQQISPLMQQISPLMQQILAPPVIAPAIPQLMMNPVQAPTQPLQQAVKPQWSFDNGPAIEGLGMAGFSYPKGIPKSFLFCPSAETPEPYANIRPAGMPPAQTPVPAPSNVWEPNPPSFVPTFSMVNDDEADSAQPTEDNAETTQTYSPTDLYDEQFFTGASNDSRDGMESPDSHSGSAQKRQSAFDRLGPVADQPKKPKLTINIQCNSDQSVREVVDETEKETDQEKYQPVHLRQDILESTDETVQKYLVYWPWKKNMSSRKTVSTRSSKSILILEREQMEEYYERDNMFFQISIKGYPPSWTKENVLDAVLEAMNGKSLIPCFIEFSETVCKMLVIRARLALAHIHKIAFIVHKDDVELTLSISQLDMSLSNLDFLPRLVLRKRLSMVYDDGENSLDLTHFTLKDDISCFIYYPLNQFTNQMDLIHVQSTVAWDFLTKLNLSYNRLTSIEGFKLEKTTPNLTDLDLSYNYIEKATSLMRLRNLGLRALKLEGNPMCTDFIDPDYYVKVLKSMFPCLVKIDGVKIHFKGEMPPSVQFHCPHEAMDLVERFIGIYFPLLESSDDKKRSFKNLYHENACLTITFRYKLRFDNTFKQIRTLFNRSRNLAEGDMESTNSALEIGNLIGNWPPMQHDPQTFTVDVLLHNDNVTIVKVSGIVKVLSDTLADEEPTLSFARTFVLHSHSGCEYRIRQEMLYWDRPTPQCARNAFKATKRQSKLSIALETPPDEDLKAKLIAIFMELTNLNKKATARCLELKSWNLKLALEYFVQLLKLDDLEYLNKDPVCN